VVQNHLNTLLSGTPVTAATVDELAEDFERAKPFLKTRIQPEDYAQGLGAIVSEPIAEGLIQILTYDFPDSVATVHPNHVAKWGVPLHDLFQLGIRNVRAEGLLESEPMTAEGGIHLEVFEDPANFFGATHALMLHEYFDPVPDLGVIVSVPTRHGFVAHPIRDGSVLTSLRGMLFVTPRMYEQGPGSITHRVYWWRYGVFTELPYDEVDNEATLRLPTSFTEQVLGPLTNETQE
jgi:hypothetical protein